MTHTPPIDEDAIRTIAALLREADLTEIEITHGESKIRVARQLSAAPVTVTTPAVAAPAAAPAVAVAAKVEGAVLSPMVGTCYRSPEPGSKPFVEPGDTVRAGQVVMIVEAMKTMNQITAERAGTVTAVFVEDGQPVEYGEPLLAIA
jgi:acetyl-CoA carboxylase biotin carboxyl carrier protein